MARRLKAEHVLIAPFLAGILGGAAGALVYVAYEVLAHGLPGGGAPYLVLMLFAAGFGGFLIGVPCNFVIGIPLVWPLRHWAARHPWRASLLYGLVGAAVAAGGIAWLDRSALFPPPLAPFYIFGFTNAAAFIWLLHWLSRPPTRAPAPPTAPREEPDQD